MKKIVNEFKAFDKLSLIEANEAAIRERRNRSIDQAILNKLSIKYMYLVIEAFEHHKGEMRLKVKLDKNYAEYLDVTDVRYETIPLVKFYDNGSHETVFFKRPYPNGRQWKEVTQIKPLRKQSKFRDDLLSAYNNCCALCSINEKKLLRGAHIVDVTKGGPDTVNNGIFLCVNHEIAFDKGIIRINPDFSVNSSFGIGVEVKKIKLPSNKDDYPSSDLLIKKLSLIDQKEE